MSYWRAAAAVCVIVASCSGTVNDDATATTTIETWIVEPPPDLGPPLEEIPQAPDTVVELEPGPDSPTETHLEFVQLLPGYELGSARVEAVYPAPEGPLHLITWRQTLESGESVCLAVAADDTSIEDWGCGSADPRDEPRGISGMSYGTDPGDNTIEVKHTPGAVATVIELRNGKVHLIRPGDSVVTYHQWNGTPPVRVTVFWPDGFTASEALIE